MLRRPHHFARHGFTLLELSIILLMSGLMLSYVLTVVQATDPRGLECIVNTRDKLMTIRGAVERFARTKDRLPLPAARNLPADSPLFGRESSGADIDTASGVSFGALPWQALGLQVDYASDCWGNKLTYMVTTALTTNASSGGYLDSTVEGNITLKTGAAVTTSQTKLAYAIISHGEDQLGAVKVNWSAANPTHGWCTGSTDIAYTNCLASVAEIMDAAFNNAKDAGTNYFDDLVIAAARPKVLSSTQPTSNAYCWGNNADGEIGDGTTTTPRKTPTLVSGGIQFAQISTGAVHTCGLDQTGKAYCWGDNTYGQLGDNSQTKRTSPVEVSGGLTFSKISAGYYETCALTTAGAAYCWGYAPVGAGATTSLTTPTAVSGGLTFSDISAGFTHACGITPAGVGYCWGYNEQGQLGVGDTTNRLAGPVAINGGLTLQKIYTGYAFGCAITTSADAYCWGYNAYGHLGDNTLVTNYSPVAVSGGLKFKQLSLGVHSVCGLTTSDTTYCWGDNSNYDNGNNSASPYYYKTPQLQTAGISFIQITRVRHGACGLTNNYLVYCWGENTHGQVGDNSTTIRGIPTLVSTAGTWPNVFGSLSSNGYGGNSHTCALNPLPPAAWGDNTYGQVGDGTTITRNTPVYVTVPSGVKYFKTVSDADIPGMQTYCGVSDAGNGYCWGYNDASYGTIGDGTKGTNKTTPTAVTMPTGVTFTAIKPGSRYGSCALGSDNKPYCWGSSYYTGLTSDRTTPGILPIASTTASAIGNVWEYGTRFIGSNGIGYYSNGWSYMTADSLPGAATAITAYVGGHQVNCALGNDGQVYCKGTADAYQAIGEGTVSGDIASYTAVTNPADAFPYKSLVLSLSAGYGMPCVIGNNDQAYCWGYGGNGQLGNGSNTTVRIPTLVTLPTGVLSWKQINASDIILTAQGSDGQWYYWGKYVIDPWESGATTYTPTKLPLPPGASGWRYVDGRIGLPY